MKVDNITNNPVNNIANNHFNNSEQLSDNVKIPQNNEEFDNDYIFQNEIPINGIYKINYNKNGSKEILFEKEVPLNTEKPDLKNGKKEICITNTDKVDLEIRNIKAKIKELERSLNSENDSQKAKLLQQQLAKLRLELLQKNNDAYRRQHASIKQQ